MVLSIARNLLLVLNVILISRKRMSCNDIEKSIAENQCE